LDSQKVGGEWICCRVVASGDIAEQRQGDKRATGISATARKVRKISRDTTAYRRQTRGALSGIFAVEGTAAFNSLISRFLGSVTAAFNSLISRFLGSVMRSFVALRQNGAGRYALVSERLRSCKHAPAAMLAALLCSLAVAGCAPAYTKPALLPHHMRSSDATPAHLHPVRYASRRPDMRPTGGLKPAKAAIPLPNPELLRPQPEPDCEFVPGDAGADDRQKLDYQQQCYRHAEIIARERLKRLQDELEKTVKPGKTGN
jgi:hypothetical protein